MTSKWRRHPRQHWGVEVNFLVHRGELKWPQTKTENGEEIGLPAFTWKTAAKCS